MSDIKPKKMVRRSVAIALVIICIILIALIAYSIVTAISATNNYDNLQKQNKQLQTWLNGNETLFNQTQANLTNLQNQIDSLNSNITGLQSEVNNMTDIANLGKSTVWVRGERVSVMDLPPTYEETAPFAGYVSVQVLSQVNTTVEVWYSSNGAGYENSTIIGWNGTVIFPVLPSNISFYFFQTMSEYFILSGPLYATVTITYYY